MLLSRHMITSFGSRLHSRDKRLTPKLLVAMKNNIEICAASDFCAINCHAFFDGNTLPEDAGEFVQNWVKQISEAAGGKTTIVTGTYFESPRSLF